MIRGASALVVAALAAGWLGCSDATQSGADAASDAGDVEAIPQPTLFLSPLGLAFEGIGIGDRAVRTLRIENLGDAELVIVGLELDAIDDLSVAAELPFRIAPGEDAEVQVTFEPTACRVSEGWLVITSNDATHPELYVPITTELRPDVAIAPSELTFDPVPVGGESTLEAEVRNVGTCTAVVDDLFVSGTSSISLEMDWEPIVSLEPGMGIPFTLRFHPREVGCVEAIVYLRSDDAATRAQDVTVTACAVE